LAQRGYHTIETDDEPDLSGWINTDTGLRIPTSQAVLPHSKQWLDNHVWAWNETLMNTLLNEAELETTFFCGGAANLPAFLPRFVGRFALRIPNPVMRQRLQSREPQRWIDGSPELARVLLRNTTHMSDHLGDGTIFIDANRPVKEITDEILEHANAAN